MSFKGIESMIQVYTIVLEVTLTLLVRVSE